VQVVEAENYRDMPLLLSDGRLKLFDADDVAIKLTGEVDWRAILNTHSRTAARGSGNEAAEISRRDYEKHLRVFSKDEVLYLAIDVRRVKSSIDEFNQREKLNGIPFGELSCTAGHSRLTWVEIPTADPLFGTSRVEAEGMAERAKANGIHINLRHCVREI